MLKFFEDFAKLNPEPAPAPAPVQDNGVTADDVKEMFDTLKESIISEIKNQSASNSSQEAADYKPVDQGANTTNILEGGQQNAS